MHAVRDSLEPPSPLRYQMTVLSHLSSILSRGKIFDLHDQVVAVIASDLGVDSNLTIITDSPRIVISRNSQPTAVEMQTFSVSGVDVHNLEATFAEPLPYASYVENVLQKILATAQLGKMSGHDVRQHSLDRFVALQCLSKIQGKCNQLWSRYFAPNAKVNLNLWTPEDGPDQITFTPLPQSALLRMLQSHDSVELDQNTPGLYHVRRPGFTIFRDLLKRAFEIILISCALNAAAEH
ncbi:hypothetical protein EUX98_g6644 [Antrodiella citrinella]|uniref:Uncharacterized protein n=1 Tax=Antrodiella citrinella TaxID=2447956 RepID=A0A4S4MP99_9APHY|nr:hypothetical protein EUX98_g6644 [Antrodiella citrinella]